MHIGLIASRPEPAKPLLPYLHSRHRSGWRMRAGLCWASLGFAAFLYGAVFALFPPAIVTPMLLPLVVLAVIVVWALPQHEGVPTRFLGWLFVGFFLSLVAWPNYLAVSLPGLPWITMERLFGIPLGLVLLVSASASWTFKTEVKEVLSATPWIWKCLAAFVTVQLLTIPLSENPFQSMQKVVIYQITWTSMFFVGCYLFRSERWVKTWSSLLVLLAAFLVIIAVWEWRIGRLPWANHIPSFLKIEDESVLRTLAGSHRTATGAYRVQGTFGTSLGLAEYLALATPFMIHAVLMVKKLAAKLAASALIVMTFFVILLTDARLGAVGFLLSFLLYGGVWAARRWRTDRSSLLGPALTLIYPLIFVAFLVSTFFVGRLRRIVWGGGAHQYSTDARLDQMNSALPLIAGQPVGHGAGQGASVLGYMNGEGVLTIDSYFLTIALEYGVLGFIFYYGMLAAAIAYAYREGMRAGTGSGTYLLPLAVSLSAFFVIKSVFSQQESHPLVFMMLGMVAAVVWRQRAQADRPRDIFPAELSLIRTRPTRKSQPRPRGAI